MKHKPSYLAILIFAILATSACGGGGGASAIEDEDDEDEIPKAKFDVSGDRQPPVVRLLGSASMTVPLGSVFSDPGVTASDDVDGDMTASVFIAGDNVDTSSEGTYTLTYTVSDAAGNASAEVRRVVTVESMVVESNPVDTTPPILTLLGDTAITISRNSAYSDPGAVAIDDIDSNLSSNIMVAGDTVNPLVIGSYAVTYNVSDSSGNSAAPLVRIVSVVNDLPTIRNFSLVHTIDSLFVNSIAVFRWGITDKNNDSVTCKLDIDSDGSVDYTIDDCTNNAEQAHTFLSAGEYSASLTISDAYSTQNQETIATTDYRVAGPLAATVSIDGPAVVEGTVLHTITIANISAEQIDNVLLSTVVPNELTFPHIFNESPIVYCDGNSVCPSGSEAFWDLGSFIGGETKSISISSVINSAALNGSDISLPFKFSGTNIDEFQVDSLVDVYNEKPADLTLNASKDPVGLNETFTYYIDIANSQADELSGSQLRVFLPDGLTVDAISDGGFALAPDEIAWTLGSIDSGEALRRTIAVTSDNDLDTGTILTAQAQLQHHAGLGIDNTANFSVTVEAQQSPQLQVAIDTASDPIKPGEKNQFQISIGNVSSRTVNDITVLLTVPEGLTFPAGISSSNVYCTGPNPCSGGSNAIWSLGELSAGETRTLNFNATVFNMLNGNLISLPISVTSPNLKHSIDLQKTVAITATSANVSMSSSIAFVQQNESFSYYFTVANSSSETLSNTKLRTFLPDGISVNTISHGGFEEHDGEIVWDLGDVETRDIERRQISVTVNQVRSGDLLRLRGELTHDDGLEIDARSDYLIKGL